MIQFLRGSYNTDQLKFLRDCLDVPCSYYDTFPANAMCVTCKKRKACTDIKSLQEFINDEIMHDLYYRKKKRK